MEDLPINSRWWKQWSQEVSRRIRESSAEDDLRTLISAGCAADSLLFRLAAILSWHDKSHDWKASGITLHKIKTAPSKLHETGDLIDQMEQIFRFRKRGSPRDRELAQSLRDYARELDEAQSILLHPARASLKVATLCSLVGYVKRTTKKEHDREVSGLIGAVMGKESYEAKNLTQWRSKYKREIALLRDFVVTPL